MDTLVALGSTASFGYSAYALFAMTRCTGAQVIWMRSWHYMHEFYFESAAMILTLITVGKMLEAHSKGKTTDALKESDEAGSEDGSTLLRDGEEVDSSDRAGKER